MILNVWLSSVNQKSHCDIFHLIHNGVYYNTKIIQVTAHAMEMWSLLLIILVQIVGILILKVKIKWSQFLTFSYCLLFLFMHPEHPHRVPPLFSFQANVIKNYDTSRLVGRDSCCLKSFFEGFSVSWLFLILSTTCTYDCPSAQECERVFFRIILFSM